MKPSRTLPTYARPFLDRLDGKWITLTSLAYAALLLAWIGLNRSDAEVASLVTNLGLLPFGPALAALCWRASASHPSGSAERRAWRLVGLGLLANGVGDAVWMVYENLLGLDPWLSWADPWYLAYPPLVLTGLLSFPRALRTRPERVRFALDVAIGVTGVVMLSWHFVLNPLLAAGGENPWALALSVVYPVTSFLIVLGAVTLALRAPAGQRGVPARLLAGGFGVLFCADTAWSHLSTLDAFASGGWVDALYAVGFLLIALAAQAERSLSQEHEDDSARTPAQFSVVPYASAVLGYGLLVAVALQPDGTSLRGLIIGAVILTALVLGRQLATVRDSLTQAAERITRRSERRLSALIRHAADLILILTPEGTITFASPSAVGALGREAETLLGRQVTDFLEGEDAEAARRFLLDALLHPGPLSGATWRARRMDGSTVFLEAVATNLTRDPVVEGIVLTLRDVSERNALERQLVHQAFHDPLTGLANRALFQDRLDHAVALTRRTGKGVAVLFLDLDRFKTVNDSLGHSAGDALLSLVAKRIRGAAREVDTVARLGGDEFALLIEHLQHMDPVASIAQRLLEVLAEPFGIEGQRVEMTGSIGIALNRPGDGHSELMRNADLAMYVAKSRGGACYEFFQPTMHSELRDRLELQGDLRHAIEHNGLRLEYQPILHLGRGTVVGAEALARWSHPTRGPIPPAEFIPLAEETGLIVPLGRWVLETACAEAAGWSALQPGAVPPYLSVNLSGRQVQDPELPETVRRALLGAGLAPVRLTLEVTEGYLMEDRARATEVLGLLRQLGIRVAIDDFGTGYSSLAYLQEIPLDYLKIPKPFVDVLRGDQPDTALAEAIVGISRALDLRVVGEGIEEFQQAEILQQLGCELGQGYLLGRPMTPEALRARLRAEPASPPLVNRGLR